MFKETIFIKTNKYDNLTFFEHKVLIHNYTTGIMGSVNSTNADAKEAETSSQPEHLEAKNQGKGVKRSQDKDIDPAQQSVSRSSETPEDLETHTNDFQIRQTSSSSGKGTFS